jgi:hypothetical protein
MSGTAPAIGDWVTYTLDDADAHLITSRRMAQPDAAKGNPVAAGDTFPALVVGAFETEPDDVENGDPAIGQVRYAYEIHPGNEGHVNLQVFLDGYDQHWATDIRPAHEDGQHGTYTAS